MCSLYATHAYLLSTVFLVDVAQVKRAMAVKDIECDVFGLAEEGVEVQITTAVDEDNAT